MADAYIVDALRTPTGKRGGALSSVHAADLGAFVLKNLMERNAVPPEDVDDFVFGCVDAVGPNAGVISRTSWLAAGLPVHVPGTVIDRACGSSQQALHFAAQAVMSGTQDVVIAGGVESMTRVPMGSNFALHRKEGIGTGPFSARIQERFGVRDFSQFTGAQMMADKYGFKREELDRFALHSHQLAAKATEAGAFKAEIVPLAIDGPEGCTRHVRDEGIRFDATAEAIGSVKLLQEGGVISAANASQICDGASGVLVVNERALKQHGLKPLARIHHMTVSAGDPVIMLEEPIPATRRALARAGMKLGDIDLFEVNEAFAPVPLAWLKELGAEPDKLNVNGGAIALGHPLGASGTKLMATLLHALRARRLKYGLQTMCEGGGMANVTIVEAL